MNIPNGDITSTIQLALAPVFLLTAVVTLLTAISARLARAVDRMRFIHGELLAPERLHANLLDYYWVEYREVKFRGRMCAIAIFFDVLSGVLISLTVLELFFFEAASRRLDAGFLAVTFVAGMACFVTALMIVLIEVVFSHHSAGWNMPIPPNPKP
jgi:hypothetical protein